MSHSGTALPGMSAARSRRLIVAGTIACLLGASAAEAQTSQQPQQQRRPRGYRGLFGGGPTPDPNRTRQDFSLTASLLGGYDDNLAAAVLGGSGSTPGQTSDGGYLGQGQIDLRYYRGRLIRSFTVEGGAYGTGYGGDSDVGIVQGGHFGLSGMTRVRERDSFQVNQRVSFEPLYQLAPLSVLGGAGQTIALPGSNTTTGLVERRSLAAQSALSYGWAQTRRNTFNFAYGFSLRRYLDDRDSIGNSNTHRGAASLVRSVNRSVSLQGNYEYSHGRFDDSAGVVPLDAHTISGGPLFQKTLSRTRRLQVGFGAGAQHVRTLSNIGARRSEVDYWTPFGEANAQFDLSRTWDLGASYRRGTVVLPEVTTQSFVTDAVSIGFGGVIGSRLEVEANAGLSTGTTASVAGGRAGNQTITWASQARWAFSRSIAASFSYDYYEYSFTETSDLPEGFPASARRNTIRVGITIWLPLVGNYLPERGGRSGRQ